MLQASPNLNPPTIPDHELIRPIGEGSFGVVWLARNILGSYHAVKIVYRQKFDSEGPYQREIKGIRHFDPISRSHQGFVPILQIGRNDAEGYFYYVMELADDSTRRKKFDPAIYKPHTLSCELARRGRLPVLECVQIGMALTAALGYLHRQRLIHGDIKPANIVFLRGQAKFADVGLVTTVGSSGAPGGTEGYMPRQGAGRPSADLYCLGKVLYEMISGKDRLEFPELPTDIASGSDVQAVRRFNDVILRACDPDPARRFQSAREMFESLEPLGKASEGEDRATRKWFQALWSDKGPPEPVEQPQLEAVGGAVPLDSAFYIERPADFDFQDAVARLDCIVLINGARQMGKTSLLARGLEQAREDGARVVLTDIQEFNEADLTALKPFYLSLADTFTDTLQLKESLASVWDETRSPNDNFARYMRRQVLADASKHLFWGMDEVDRLFTTPFGGQVFGMFRAWYNKRALDPHGPWGRLTLAISYATEARLFITDLNQSPFNVGTHVTLQDFTLDQVAELNRRYGDPLRTGAELTRFVDLLGGQPYLTRRGLHELVTKHFGLSVLESLAAGDDGPFGGHLRRLAFALQQDRGLTDAVKGVLQEKPCPTTESFYRLCSAGVLTGASAQEARPRCQLYATYLRKTLFGDAPTA